MDSSTEKIPSAEAPAHFTGLKLGKIKTVAAGIPAVMISAQHILKEAGALRGMKALLKLNQ